jgi:hypothetical protein
MAVGLAIVALGGLWWGSVVASDTDRDRPLLAAAALLGAALDLAAGRLAPPWGSPLVWLAPTLFLWAAFPPALSSMAFPDGRGQSRGLFPAFALFVVCAALGPWSLAVRPDWAERLPPALAADLAMVAMALMAWPWTRSRQAMAELRLWPAYSLGVFKGKVYGQDLAISERLARTVAPASTLGAAAAASALGPRFWGGPLWPLLALTAAGALILGPLLALLASPVTALALNLGLLALALGLELAPPPETDLGSTLQAIAPLLPLGALWPLAARIQVARSQCVAQAIARLGALILAGLLAGQAAGFPPLGPLDRSWPLLAAWAAAMTALAPRLGWFAALALWALAAALIRFL